MRVLLWMVESGLSGRLTHNNGVQTAGQTGGERRSALEVLPNHCRRLRNHFPGSSSCMETPS